MGVGLKFSFIHTADIHLGRAFADVGYNLTDKQKSLLSRAHEDAFDELCEFAIEKSVDFILIAGDTFDDCERDLHSKLKLARALRRFESENIAVYMVCGNHDPQFSYVQELGFKDSSKINIFGVNRLQEPLVLKDENNCEYAKIFPFGFADKFYEQSPCNVLEKASDKTLFNIGLIHCDIQQGENYAPCTEKELLDLGYDYYALGHIHRRLENDKIVYPGTIQARGRKDEGIHGFKYVCVEDKSIVKDEFVPCDKIRYYNDIEYSLANDETQIESFENIRSRLLDLKDDMEMIIVTLKLVGGRNYDKIVYNDLVKELIADNIIVSKINDFSYVNIDVDLIKKSEGLLAEILLTLDNKPVMDDIIEATQKELSDALKMVSNYDLSESLSKVSLKLNDICAQIYTGGDVNE